MRRMIVEASSLPESITALPDKGDNLDKGTTGTIEQLFQPLALDATLAAYIHTLIIGVLTLCSRLRFPTAHPSLWCPISCPSGAHFPQEPISTVPARRRLSMQPGDS